MNPTSRDDDQNPVVELSSGPTWAERAGLDPLAAVLDPADHVGVKNQLIDRIQRGALRAALRDEQSPLRILDFGCGTGRMTAWLSGLGHHVEGADPVPEMVAAARAQHPGLEFAQIEGDRLPQTDGSVDVALAIGVLTFLLPDVDRITPALSELHRVVRPGGRLIAVEQAHGGQLDRGGTLRDYRVRFAEAGFDMTKTTPIRFSDSRVLAHVMARPFLARVPGIARLALVEARRRDPEAVVPGHYADMLFEASRR